MIGRGWHVLLLAGAWTVTSGCVPRGPSSPLVRADEQKPHQMRYAVTMVDSDVRHGLLFVNHADGALPRGQAEARVQMQNRFPSKMLWADVRFVFYDADGIAVDESAWQPVVFPPHQVVLLRELSLRDDVKTFSTQLRGLRSADGMPVSNPVTGLGSVAEKGITVQSALPE